MRVRIRMVNQDQFQIEDLETEQAMALVDEWEKLLERNAGSSVLTWVMDPNEGNHDEGVIKMNASQISSIELD